MMLVPPPGLTHIHSPIHHCYWGLFWGCSEVVPGFFGVFSDDDNDHDEDDDDQLNQVQGWRQSK